MKNEGIKTYSVHPGGIFTPLQRHLEKEEMIALGWLGEDGELSEMAAANFKSTSLKGQPLVFGAQLAQC